MNGSYVVFRQASLALAYPLACCRTMDLQRLNDALQLLHPIPQTDNVHAHRSIRIKVEILDGSPVHNALALRLTRFPLATCLAQAMGSYADQAPHQAHGHLPARASHSRYRPHRRHVQKRLGFHLPYASKYQSLPDNGVPFPGFHVVQKRSPGFHPVYRCLQMMQHHRQGRSALLDRQARSVDRLVESHLFQRGPDGCYRNHPRS